MRIKLLDLDLATDHEVPNVAARYDAVRVLTRLHGVPVGWTRVDTDPDQLEPSTLRRRAAAQLTEQLGDEVLRQTLLAGAPRATSASADHAANASPDITVVVCTRNRPRLLDGCLAALAVQSYPDYQVLVVDNAPEDDRTAEVCERWNVRRIVEQRRGLDWARNRGLAEARTAVVAYTDDDARPDPGWVAAIAHAFTVPDVAALAGLVVAAELDTVSQQLFEDEYGMGKGFVARLYRRRGLPMTYAINRYGTGCNMAFRREVLQRLGGFDTALDAGTATGGGGDLDMFQRVIEAGAAVVYRPEALVRHIHRRTIESLRRQLYDNGTAYSAALWAAFRRARGSERVSVMLEYRRWLKWWIWPRLSDRIRRRGAKMPIRLILAEFRGGMLGPLLYRRARREARKLAEERP